MHESRAKRGDEGLAVPPILHHRCEASSEGISLVEYQSLLA